MTPQTEQELLQRAQAIAGLRFADLAQSLHMPVPPDLKRDKGWVGMLVKPLSVQPQAVKLSKILRTWGLS